MLHTDDAPPNDDQLRSLVETLGTANTGTWQEAELREVVPTTDSL